MFKIEGNRLFVSFFGIRMKFEINNYFKNKVYISKNGKLKRIYFAPKGLKIDLLGEGANIILPCGRCFNNVKIIANTNSQIQIQYPHKWSINSLVLEAGYGNKIYIGENFNIVSGVFSACGSETEIKIGKDCMFSSNITIMTHDGHAIFDVASKNALNKPQSVVVGNHCWFAKNVALIKGAEIQDNTVVGINSIVNKKIEEQNCVIAGNPAKVVKSNTNWNRNSYDGYSKNIKEN